MYTLLEDGRVKIEQYQKSSPFASFLPGLAGTDGIPMWAFYVNRGQGMASFGVENKDNAMTEFFPADKSFQLVPTQGFRTFIKGKRVNKSFRYEPFAYESDHIKDTIIIGKNTLELAHKNTKENLVINVSYYVLPHQSLPGLVREVTIENTADEPVSLDFVDGLATMFPAHVGNEGYKSIGNTFKSWFDATVVDEFFSYYFLRGSTSDDAEVSQTDEGNFYVSLLQTEEKEKLISPIVDRQVIFGDDLTLQIPKSFYKKEEIDREKQVGTNKVSCAFSAAKKELAGKEKLKLFSLFGQAQSREQAKEFVKAAASSEAFKAYKKEAVELVETLTSKVETKTAIHEFDDYVKQNYLDNGLRGGFPTVFENKGNKQVFYLYSRKHGDLERDYNYFSINPEFYSQGNGNYRDVNQNRRLDVLFEPRVEDHTIRQFMNLIQLDGYNPLSIKTVKFTLGNHYFNFQKYGLTTTQGDVLKKVCLEGFTPGNIKGFILDEDINLNTSFESFLTDLLSESEETLEAEHGEGFWIDHWTYNLDLIDSYLSIYPDKKQDLFFAEGYRFFDSPASVNSREEKYNKTNDSVRQYNAIAIDKEKMEKQSKGKEMWINAKGQEFTTNLYSKLVLLAANKVSSIAPFGLGIEMEAGRPGWNDAMNGLPGMLGSGTSELYELKRLFELLKELSFENESVALPEESGEFIIELNSFAAKTTKLDLAQWNQLTQIRENYRVKIREDISGEKFVRSTDEMTSVVDAFESFVHQAIKATEQFKADLAPTYFYFDAALSESGEVVSLTPHAVAPFLEGIVKKMKSLKSTEEARALYNQVRQSDLYDKKLGMYKTSGSIEAEPIELGRAKFFTPGWLENESVFLHMSYKYLLELIKNDLYDEFFEEIKTGLVCFTDPKVYGRSILENSSFLASSTNPDEQLHGKGFVARLSGSTVEFLNMWIELFIGNQPFAVRENELVFQLRPKLSSDFFGDRKEVSFKLFGEIDVTYDNETGNPTFGKQGVQPIEYTLTLHDGNEKTIQGDGVKGEWAEKIRNREVEAITVLLK